MSNSDGSSERRENATPRRLRDARKRGQVSSSRDLSRTATSLVWLLLFVALPATFYRQLAQLAESTLRSTLSVNEVDLLAYVWNGGEVLLMLTAIPIGFVALVGTLVTRFQIGPVFAFERIKAKLSNISPAAGFKRVFSAANLFETIKGLVKVALIFGLVAIIVRHYADDIRKLIEQNAIVVGELDHWLHVVVLAATTAALLLVAIGDFIFQKFDYLRQLRMSTEEVRRERQTHEGDPQLRSQRRRLQRQWATGNARQAARNATALVVNPTHIAVALHYAPESTPVPVVTGTGEGKLAALMRQEAQLAGVPVLRSITLARSLYFICEDDDEVPERLFDAVAEVLVWANDVRERIDNGDDAAAYREAGPAFDRLVDHH